MPVKINSVTYFRTADVCKMVGISRSTLFRWLGKTEFINKERRDIRVWRLFTKGEIDKLITQINRIQIIDRKTPH
jgi:predicted DNA-binding transcriptional regulator AlpA